MTVLSAKSAGTKAALALLTGVCMLSQMALAEQSQHHPHAQIIQTAEHFLRQNIRQNHYSRITVTMGQLDSRLRLQHCRAPLTTELAPGRRFAGKTTVHVKCTGETPWAVFINANIQLYKQVMVTATPLDRGHILKASDFRPMEMELSRLNHGFYTEAGALIGQQLKRRLNQHKVIKANYIKPPTLVKRGEIVSIVAENASYSVKMNGTALMNGAQGDRIRVRNLSSKRIIEATVRASGVVDIN